MRPSLVLAWLVVLLVSVGMLITFGRGAMKARFELAQSQHTLRVVSGQAEEFRKQQQGKPSLPPLPKTKDALGVRVSVVLTSCGLPASSLGSVNPHGDQAIAFGDGPERYIRRRATLNLVNVTLPKLGSFLQAWRSAEPAWVPTAIDINPTIPKAGSPGGDLPLNITIALEALFEETTGGRR